MNKRMICRRCNSILAPGNYYCPRCGERGIEVDSEEEKISRSSANYRAQRTEPREYQMDDGGNARRGELPRRPGWSGGELPRRSGSGQPGRPGGDQPRRPGSGQLGRPGGGSTNPAVILLGAIAVVLLMMIGTLSFLVLSSKKNDSENAVADASQDEKGQAEQTDSEVAKDSEAQETAEKESSTGSADSGLASSDPLSIIIWDSAQRAGIQEICDDWTALGNPKVEVKATDWGDYWTRIESGAAGGTLPDVFWMNSDYCRIYMDNDVLMDLTEYIEKDGVDMNMYYPDLVSIYTRSDGRIFALPKDHDTIALLYNKTLFDRAGVEYPTDEWTYQDMYEAAKAITEATDDDIYGVAIDTINDQDGWYNYVYAYGGNVINGERTDTDIDSPESKEGMEMVRKMLTVGTPESVLEEYSVDYLFLEGKAAMITQGSWMASTYYLPINSEEYAWAEIPYYDRNDDGACQKDERWSCYNGLGWAASADTDNPDAAASLIEYLCSRDAQIKQARLGVTMAGMPGISDEFVSAFEGMDVSAFVKVEENGTLFARPCTRNTGVWQGAVESQGGFLDAWYEPENSQAMADACDRAASIIRESIAAE